mmetsp:Transcript_11575/g.21900  ORF Transcript_11575/g.21900 Transcript_11575/m.21900 type:complete len:117 (-) Transcript_11575:12-362(-)
MRLPVALAPTPDAELLLQKLAQTYSLQNSRACGVEKTLPMAVLELNLGASKPRVIQREQVCARDSEERGPNPGATSALAIFQAISASLAAVFAGCCPCLVAPEPLEWGLTIRRHFC